METINFPPAGVCIYCGATRYSQSKIKLGREHIIPEALSGSFVLPEASCQRCENLINRHIEQPLLRGYFDDLRLRYAMRSKKSSKTRPKEGLVHFLKGGVRKSVIMPYSVAPALLTMQVYPGPGYFEYDFSPDRYWRNPLFIKNIISTPLLQFQAAALDVDGLDDTCTREQLDIFPYFLAKIAHSYSWALGYFKDYRPVLPPYIIGEPMPVSVSFFVGGEFDWMKDQFPTEKGKGREGEHLLETFQAETSHHGILLASVQLFSHLNTPRYMVITGLRPPQPENVSAP